MDFSVKNVTDRVGNEFLRVTMFMEDGKQAMRTLTIEQFCRLLRQSQEEELTYIEYDKGFYPENTLFAKMADKSNFDVVWAENPGKRLVVYRDKHYLVPFPKLIFAISVRKGFAQSKYCFAQKLDGGNDLYNYPFGNVAEGGSICMGNIKFDLSSHVADFSEDFYLGETNDDYYGDGDYKVTIKATQGQLLTKLTKLDAFPDRWLVKCNGYDLEGLIKQYKSKN